ncbi:FtsX-like permease family protein [Catellatospora vulcania]|uniref:FtsX-like permease family protein n=1 Tax=Catellatospora vulcania TaxID=1460450 RepID=UPI0018AFF325|nr:FtsX-like permease family protein [Catellatospora vulcania]
MIALASLRERHRSLLGTLMTLAVAVAVLTVCGLLLVSARPVTPDRYAASPVLIRPVPPAAPEAFTEPRPWPKEQAATLTARLAALPEVSAAVPVHRFHAQLLRDGRPVAGEHDAYNWSAAALGGHRLRAGRAPAAAGEVVLGAAFDSPPGARVELLTASGPETFTVTGTADGAGIWVGDRVADARGAAQVIGLLTGADTDAATVAAAAVAAVGADGVVLAGDARGALEPVGDARTRWIGMQVLSALSALGVFVSVFIVASTFAFATRQRERELGLLRLLGAVPRQVRRWVLGEVLLLGLLGGAVGVPVGLLAAGPVAGWLIRTGFEPASFTVLYQPVVPVAAMVAGVLVALVGAWAAARRAARVGPLAALRAAAVDDRPVTLVRLLAGGVALAAAVAAGVAATRASGADLGTYALYAAMALVTAGSLLAPLLLPPAVRLLTMPFTGGRGAIVLLVRQHVGTAARRSASTAAPVLLCVAFTVLIGGMVQTTTAYYGLNRVTAANATAVVVPDGTPGLSDAAVAAAGGLSALPTTLYDGTEPLPAAGITPAEHALLAVADGSLSALHGLAAASLATPVGSAPPPGPADRVVPAGPAGRVLAVAVAEGFARQAGWAVGSMHPVSGPDGEPVTLRVVAVLAGGPLPASVLLDRAAVRAMDPSALTLVVYSGQPVPRAALAGLGARPLSAAAYAASGQDADDRLVWVFTALLIGVSAGFGLLAVVNTMLMSTSGRAADLRVLRLSGATRGQVLGMLAAETAAVVATGAVLGLAVAVAALAALARGLSAQLGVAVPMVVPWGTLAATVGVCLVLAVAAATLPALGSRRQGGAVGGV